MTSAVPAIDPGTRQRLTARFGGDVAPWFGELPAVLTELAARWRFELGPAIPRGSTSVVFHCRTADRRHAVLKISPDRARLAFEASALNAWETAQTPAVIAVDEQLGALLIEAVEPGTPLAVSAVYPTVESVAGLVTSLHAGALPDRGYPSVAQRIGYLFDASATLYDRNPDLLAVVPASLYERGHARAIRLARDDMSTVLLHGDLTPSNILDGGAERGLVAIDPAPCVGDPAFDAVDLILWNADHLGTIEARAARLGAAAGLDPHRLLDWCSAFAGMCALESASAGNVVNPQMEALLNLASQVPHNPVH